MIKSIYQNIVELFNEKQDFIIATILDKSGPVPREEGTKMIIKKDLSIIGTIGGGLLEATVIKAARDIFQNLFSNKENEKFKVSCFIKKFNLNNKDASLEGMVCGGELRIFMEYINTDDNKLKKIYELASKYNDDRNNFVMITQINENNCFINSPKWLCTETNFYGDENKEAYAIYKKTSENFKNQKVEVMVVNNIKYLVEPLLNYETIFIIGAGHIGQKLASLTKMINFRTVVIDDRNEFANKNRFPDADEIVVLNSFDNILSRIKIDNQSYIVIVTRGHIYDKDVLGQVIKTNAKYIGMIGSKKKRDFIYNSLLNEGCTNEELNRVYSPIGLNIFAETPEEISVSIAAELIKVRREKI